MTVILSSNVDLYPTMMRSSAQPAVVQLTDDHRFRLATIDPTTKAELAVVMDVPVTALTVTGGTAFLNFTANGITARAGFSYAGSVLEGGGGLVGMAVGSEIAKKSGVDEFATALAAQGVSVRRGGTSAGRSRNSLILIGVVVVVVVIWLVANIGRIT